jgi:O-antigen/teichoic acid export membrane protein
VSGKVNATARLPASSVPTSTSRVQSAAVSSAAIKIASFVLNFAAAVAAARLLSAGGFGRYSNALALYDLMVIPAALGMNQLLVREFAVARRAGAYDTVFQLLRAARGATLASAAVCALAASAFAWIMWRGSDAAMAASAVILLAVALPFGAFSQLWQAVLRGTDRISLGLLPDQIIRPFTVLAAAGVIMMSGIRSLEPMQMAAVFSVGAGLSYAFARAAAARTMPVRPAAAPAGDGRTTRLLLLSALPLLVVTLMQTVTSKSATVILAATSDPATVGLYAAAARISDWILFMQTTTNIALGPMIAALHAGGDHADLQQVLRRTVRTTAAFAVAAGLLMCVLSVPLLSLYGAEFTRAADMLRVLAVGRMLSVCAGPAALILIMTGHERRAARGLVIGAAATILATCVLVPVIGGMGAAIGTSIGLVAWNAVLAFDVYSLFSINPTATAALRVTA